MSKARSSRELARAAADLPAGGQIGRIDEVVEAGYGMGGFFRHLPVLWRVAGRTAE